MKTILVCNQKGGVGKTTTAVNITASLRALGKRTLLCDFDPQANSTSGMGVDKAASRGVYDVLINGADVTASVVPRVERSAPVRSAMTLRWALCGPNRALASVGSSKDRVSTKAVDDAGVCIDSERRPRAAGGDGLSNPLHGRRAVRQFGNAL